jgi:hypothetical protein
MRSRSSSLLRGHDQVLEHLDLVRVDRARVDLDVADLLGAGDHDAHRAAPGGRLDRGLLELLLRLRHLRLHLLRHLGDLADVHACASQSALAHLRRSTVIAPPVRRPARRR